MLIVEPDFAAIRPQKAIFVLVKIVQKMRLEGRYRPRPVFGVDLLHPPARPQTIGGLETQNSFDIFTDPGWLGLIVLNPKRIDDGWTIGQHMRQTLGSFTQVFFGLLASRNILKSAMHFDNLALLIAHSFASGAHPNPLSAGGDNLELFIVRYAAFRTGAVNLSNLFTPFRRVEIDPLCDQRGKSGRRFMNGRDFI